MNTCSIIAIALGLACIGLMIRLLIEDEMRNKLNLRISMLERNKAPDA